MHDITLITTVAAAFTSAWALGLITQWLGLSPIVGYLLAGILIGPHTPGFSGDVQLAQQLAEIGIILLMFGVGLHFHLKDLLAVKRVAIPGAIGQVLVAMVVSIGVFGLFGFSVGAGAVLGIAMAVASTVVLIRVLTDAGVLESPAGHVAVGWLIVEDLLTVVVLVLIPLVGANAGAQTNIWTALALALLKLGALVVIVLFGGSRAIPWLLVRVARLRSRELFTLTVLVVAIAIAAIAYFVFGASMALGAFLAGMVVSQSPVSHQAASDALPLRDAFAVIFFVSVGMLFDPGFVLREPLLVGAGLAVVLVAKPAAALIIVALLGRPMRTALTVAVGLAQIGEFSFILSDLARRNGLMNDDGHNLLVAAAILSISLNPILFRSIDRIEGRLRRSPRLWSFIAARSEKPGALPGAPATVHGEGGDGVSRAVVMGYGVVGRAVDRYLKDNGFETVIVDTNMETITRLATMGRRAVFGDASSHTVLEGARIARASHIFVTMPNAADAVAAVLAARSLNPAAKIYARVRFLRDKKAILQAGADAAVFEEELAADALAALALSGD